MGKLGGFFDALKFGSKSTDDAMSSTKAIGGSGSVTVSKVDPLDPASTYRKAAAAEPNLKNILAAETPTVKSVSPVATLPKSVSPVDAGKIAVKTQATETANSILRQANKNSSVLGSLGKVAAATGIGVLVGGALAGTAAASTVLNPELPGGGNGGMPQTVTPGTDGSGSPTYIYQTGNSGVDDALGWLQQQIDEIVEFLNGLLGGGSGGGSGGGAFVTGEDDGSTAATGKKMKLVAVIALVIIVGAAYFLTRKKQGKKGKKAGRK